MNGNVQSPLLCYFPSQGNNFQLQAQTHTSQSRMLNVPTPSLFGSFSVLRLANWNIILALTTLAWHFVHCNDYE